MAFVVNGNIIRCPKFLEVNGSLELPSYEIKQGDQIETRSFYTVGQLAEFMDVEVSKEHVILVNNREANLDTLIYENFTIEWTVISYKSSAYMPQVLSEEEVEEETEETSTEEVVEEKETVESGKENLTGDVDTVENEPEMESEGETVAENAATENLWNTTVPVQDANPLDQPPGTIGILVYVNGQPVRLTGKQRYVFVDIFDFYQFDLTQSRGRSVITNLNGQNAQYSAELQAGDEIELGWKEN